MQKAVELKGQIKSSELELKATLSKISDALEDGRLDDYMLDDSGKSLEFLGWRFSRKHRTATEWNEDAKALMAEPKKALEKAEYHARRMNWFTKSETHYWELRQLKK